jgi:hypothetical protein
MSTSGSSGNRKKKNLDDMILNIILNEIFFELNRWSSVDKDLIAFDSRQYLGNKP